MGSSFLLCCVLMERKWLLAVKSGVTENNQ